MNPEVRDKWIQALRSGKYQQGKSFLNVNDETFCCLGVLCELAFEEGIVTKDFDKSFFLFSYSGFHEVLPSQVSRWAGFNDSENPNCNPHYYSPTFTELNDDHQLTFEQIADIIEKNF